MGYKLAGCEVVAANDIDPKMASHYRRNLNPKHYFLCPIRDLVSSTLPSELIGIDILDGSPPCSTFSFAGDREKSWGKEKYFREGQAKQVLSDLFFDYLDLAEKIRPKVIIAENVKGMILGNAKGYCRLVMSRLVELGYRPQLFLINSADCGVPQRRERVFFCAVREDVSTSKLRLAPRSRWISAGEACRDIVLTKEEIEETAPPPVTKKAWSSTKQGQSFKHWFERETGKASWWQHCRLAEKQPAPTITANLHLFNHWSEMRLLCFREWKRLASFPDDYKADGPSIGKYMIGMSVPPKMTEAVARAICSQWLGA